MPNSSVNAEHNLEREYLLVPQQEGQRLDAALALFFPQLALRARRRLWNEYIMEIDGLERSAAFRVCAGQSLCLKRRPSASSEAQVPAFLTRDEAAHLFALKDAYYFFYKPAGLHTEKQAGSLAASLEALLLSLMTSPLASPSALSLSAPGKMYLDVTNNVGRELPFLLTRLDQGTSGLVLATASAGAGQDWHRYEAEKKVEKYYIALLEGSLDQSLLVDKVLDTRNKQRVRVLAHTGDPLRQTQIEPLVQIRAGDLPDFAPGYPPDAWCTLALCLIYTGARHQIRAHAAHAGHALLGDRRYGATHDNFFCLHHLALCWPRAKIVCRPAWLGLLSPLLRERLEARLHSLGF